MSNDTADRLMIEALRNGDEKAYRMVYERHYAVMCHFANAYLHDSYLAESIAGDVIFHFWEIRESVRVEQSLRSYLLQAVKNRCLNHLQSNYSRRVVQTSRLSPRGADVVRRELGRFIDTAHPLGQLLHAELEDEVSRAIDSLPRECREVFRMSRFDHNNYEEIAKRLGVSVNTVKYHIKNALRLLRKQLGGYIKK